MKRHQFMLDLLRPELRDENLVETLGYKQELTVEDFDEIIENATKVIDAAKTRQAMLRK